MKRILVLIVMLFVSCLAWVKIHDKVKVNIDTWRCSQKGQTCIFNSQDYTIRIEGDEIIVYPRVTATPPPTPTPIPVSILKFMPLKTIDGGCQYITYLTVPGKMDMSVITLTHIYKITIDGKIIFDDGVASGTIYIEHAPNSNEGYCDISLSSNQLE